MSEPEFEAKREGDAFLYLWHALGYGLAFEQLQDDRWGLYGELLVRTVRPMSSTGRPGHVYQSRFNLSSGTDRDKLAKSLGERTQPSPIPWRDMLEIACVETIRQFREGEPTVDLSQTQIISQEHLIEGMIPAGETSVLYGDGASSKSFIALAMGLAVRTGFEVGPFVPTRQASVLCLDWETTEQEQSERLHRLASAIGYEEPPTIFYRPMWRALAGDIETTRREVERLQVGLVIIDSIALAVGGDVSAEGVIPFFNALRAFGPRVTRLVISHVSKSTAQQETGIGNAYGSVFVTNFARSAWAIQREENTQEDGSVIEVGCFHRKVNRGRLQRPVGVRIEFQDPSGPIVMRRADVLENPDLVQHGTIAERLSAALRDGARSTSELTDLTGATKGTILRTLTRRRENFVQLDAGKRGTDARWGLLTGGKSG